MLKAMATKIDITPGVDEAVGLLGYGDFKSYTTSDPPPAGSAPLRETMYARVLMLREEKPDGRTETVVLVGLDCWGAIETPVTVRGIHGSGTRVFDPTLPSGTCGAWAEAAGVPVQNLSIHPTHTHYAPALTGARANKVTAEIHALGNSSGWKQVTVHGGVVSSDLCRSRLPNLGDSSVDRSLIVMDFRDEDNRSVAHLVNFGVHPTFLGDKRATSPDFVGLAMNKLEERKPGISLFLQGWSGDLEPNYGRLDPPVTRSYQEMTKMAEWLADQASRGLEDAKILAGDRLKAVQLPTTKFPVRDRGLSDEVTFQGIAIGDRAVLVAVSGEMYQDYGPILTEYSSSFMLSCGVANGYSGYIPTARGFGIQSYETNTTPFTSGAEGHVRAAFQELFKRLS